MTDRPVIVGVHGPRIGPADALAPLRQARLDLERLTADDNRTAARRLHLAEAASERTAGEPPRALAGDPVFDAWTKLDTALAAVTAPRTFAKAPEPPTRRLPIGHTAPGVPSPTASSSPPVSRQGSLREALQNINGGPFRTRIRVKSESASIVHDPVPESPNTALPSPDTSLSVVDDLTRIRGITPTLAVALRAEGVTRFSEIATWTSADTRRFATALGLGRRISRENWIEQAAILARLTGTAAAAPAPRDRRTDAGATRIDPIAPAMAVATVVITSVEDEPAEDADDAAEAVLSNGAADHIETPPTIVSTATADAPFALPAAPEATQTDERGAPLPLVDVMNIRGMTPLVADRLAKRGCEGVEEIARWTSDDVARMSIYLGPAARISRDAWIEQAAMLAAGRPTAHARRRARGEFDALAATPPDTTVWQPSPPSVVAPQSIPARPVPTQSEPAIRPTVTLAKVIEVAQASAARQVHAAATEDSTSSETTGQAAAGSTAHPADASQQSDLAAHAPASPSSDAEEAASPSDPTSAEEFDVARLIARTNEVQERLGKRLSRLKRDISGLRIEPPPETEDAAARRRSLARRLDRLSGGTNVPLPPLEPSPSATSPAPTRPTPVANAEPEADSVDDRTAHDGEADVRIVVQTDDTARSVEAVPAQPPTPRNTIRISPRRLIEQLKRARDVRAARLEAPAVSYRSTIEEASVEIVRIDGPVTRSEPEPTEDAAPPEPKPASGVSRFLRALDGKH